MNIQMRPWVAMLVVFTLGSNSSALLPSEILIVNSDQAVAKYTQAQLEFMRYFAGKLANPADKPVITLDLGTGQLNGLNDEDIEGAVFEAKPKLIYCIGQKACVTANTLGLARRYPLVFSGVINWSSLQGGKNTNKNIWSIAPDLPAKIQLTLFRYFFPQIKTLGVLTSKQYAPQWLPEAQRYAETLSMSVQAVVVTEPQQLPRALSSVMQNIDALWLVADPLVLANQAAVASIFQQARQAKKAVLAYDESFMASGATLALGVDTPTIARQAAVVAEQILQGQPPTEWVQYPAGSQITISLTAVKQSGLILNEEALSSAYRIIE